MIRCHHNDMKITTHTKLRTLAAIKHVLLYATESPTLVVEGDKVLIRIPIHEVPTQESLTTAMNDEWPLVGFGPKPEVQFR